MAAFPSRPEDLDAAWLEGQLRGAGLLADGRIVGITSERIGAGQMGDSLRFDLRYDREGAGPPSLVGKFPSTDATSRQTAASLGVYITETRFYKELRSLLDVRVPACYAAETNAEGTEFILLFEDLGPARIGNQLTSCSVEDARAAIRQAAAFHAPSRNNPAVLDAGWTRRSPEFISHIVTLYPKAHEIFRERYAGVLAPELMRVCEGMCETAGLFMYRKTPDNCLVHGDYRLDNILFDIRGGREPVAILDWQVCHQGNGLVDIGFFLGCGTGSTLRRPHERELLELYCAEMSRRGVRLTVDDVWDDYRIGACLGLMQAVFSAAFVMRTERGDQSFLSMATGAAELMHDHDSIGVLRHEARRG